MIDTARDIDAPAVTGRAEKRVLVVDDEPDSRHIFRHMLEDLGYGVIEAEDGASALLTMGDRGEGDGERDGIALIITDYQMPDMNGLEFVRRVRRTFPLVPIIMITAYGSVETYLRSQSMNVFEYINKPVKKRELDVIVKAALGAADRERGD